ncbi:BglG family transcription antiterminator [Brevibacillus fulvus]|uniref:Mannitol operon transcriptional antiterminator n=1 Tax=Brevibacillus fulvus TaxID=1125967 RepID=A0A938Y533_9BACL|nr:BglG family transcription antiterminator [Brevibacillus fulvus]MBM7591385.1 mannitol operon transcriptional antiterminator [Brevibacillus fulvus]
MTVTSRQRLILNVLLAEPQGVTVREIAEQVEVSTRTVHRELGELEHLLADYDLRLTKKAGIGIFLEGDLEKKEQLQASLYNQTSIEYTPEERKLLIRCQLLEATEPVKLVALSYDLKVTTATISYDLDELEDWFAKYELTLIRRRGYGVELHGAESAKRKAMSDLIAEHLDEFELLGVLKENIQSKSFRHINTVSERLLGLIEKEKLFVIEDTLNKMAGELPYPLADSSFIGLVIHLALAIERIEKGVQINFDEEALAELRNTPEYGIAEQIIHHLRNVFQLDIPEAEIGYITMHLRGAKLRSTYEQHAEHRNMELAAKVAQLIHHCEQKLGVSFHEDRTLLEGLLIHLEPAIYRVQKNMKIRNPLLGEIKDRYSELFRVVKEAVALVFSEWTVPDEEIGYLVMHFGSSLERMAQSGQRHRALIVCSSGIGSSKILASRIRKELPHIQPIQNVSLFEIDRVPTSQYDFIISTIPLPKDKADYILVSPLLTKEDIQNIDQFLRQKSYRPVHNGLSMIEEEQQLLAELKEWRDSLHYAIEIIESIRCEELGNAGLALNQVVAEICERLEAQQVLTDQEAVARKLLEREKLGGLGIPGPKLALFHSRSAEIAKPSLTLYYLSHPLTLQSMEEKKMEVDKLLFLLGPQSMPREGLEILSEISALLIEEEIVPILTERSQQRVRAYFLKQIYKFIGEKRNKER